MARIATLFQLILLVVLPVVLTTIFLLTPSSAVAATDIPLSQVSLVYSASSNELVLEVSADSSVTYTLTYHRTDTDTQESVSGEMAAANDVAQTRIYIGTCSADDCTPHPIDGGTLTLVRTGDAAGFEQEFHIESGFVRWTSTTQFPTLAECQDEDGPYAGKMTFCHATSAEDNPYSVVTTSCNAIYANAQGQGGHLDENGNPVSGHEDDVMADENGLCPGQVVGDPIDENPGDGEEPGDDDGEDPGDGDGEEPDDDIASGSAQLSIGKTNNKWPLAQRVGAVVTYTLEVTTTGNSVEDVVVTDLPPEGFKYVKGSWTAQSSVRGDLKEAEVTGEPTYASPGDWQLGPVQPGEIVTLTYQAQIQSDVDEGTYPDLAWARGYDVGGTQVLALAQPTGFIDTNFVGTQVAVEAEETSGSVAGVTVERTEERTVERQRSSANGQVLGAATVLPETGAHTWLTLSGVALTLIGIVCTWLGLRPASPSQTNNSSGKSVVEKALVSALCIAFVVGVPLQVNAATSLSLRVEQPKATATGGFVLDYVSLDLLDRSVTIDCYKKAPNEASFTQFSSQTLQAGGDSDRCTISTDLVSGEGTHQFYVVATAGSETVTSSVRTVDISTQGPGTPTNYSKSSVGSCDDRLSFTTASDSKTVRVDVYRSDQTSFNADAGSRITSISIGPNESYAYTVARPQCGTTYYYALRAFDVVGNSSGVVSDSVVTIKEKEVVTEGGTTTTIQSPSGTAQTSGATTQAAQARPVAVRTNAAAGGATVPNATTPGIAGEGAEVLGQQVEIADQAESGTEPEVVVGDTGGVQEPGQVLGATDEKAQPWQTWLLIGGGVGVVLLILAGYAATQRA